MFIFRRSIAGPVVALTFLAVLVVADAQFDVNPRRTPLGDDAPDAIRRAVTVALGAASDSPAPARPGAYTRTPASERYHARRRVQTMNTGVTDMADDKSKGTTGEGTSDEDIGRPGPWGEGRYQQRGGRIDVSVQTPPGTVPNADTRVSKPVTLKDYEFPGQEAHTDKDGDVILPGGD
jgi:hypothetical protein